tara:strand:+ start:283 stop:504 length:222 start_codon:yes stop_codon:yes gene_type:complete
MVWEYFVYPIILVTTILQLYILSRLIIFFDDILPLVKKEIQPSWTNLPNRKKIPPPPPLMNPPIKPYGDEKFI